MWVFETITISIIAGLFLLLMFTRKSGWIKLLLGALTTVSAIASMIFFILMQHAAGNPDQGQESMQLYLPCAAYSIVILCGVIAVFTSRKKAERQGCQEGRYVPQTTATSPSKTEKSSNSPSKLQNLHRKSVI